MILENWSCCGGTQEEMLRNLHAPPEQQRVYLQGTVYGHTKFLDGEQVLTTHIVAATGRVVITRSGSVYTLGEPQPKYVQFCIDQGCHVPTQEEPIRCSSRNVLANSL